MVAEPVKKPESAEVVVSHRHEPEKSLTERVRSPFGEVEKMFDRMRESFFTPFGWMRPAEWPSWGEMTKSLPFGGHWPKMDVIDRDEEVLIKAEIPGVEKKDLEVTVTDDAVTIRGEKKREEKEEKGDYFRCEIERGEFVRTLALPAGVDGAKAKATFKEGVLELSLPKKEKVKRHSVAIS